MRINKFVAAASSLSRRKADELIAAGKVTINGTIPAAGQPVTDTDVVRLGTRILVLPTKTTIMLHKPVGYVVSREGQGSRTIFELLPSKYQHLKPVGRLDKDSSGLLLLTNDGDLANELTHPSHQKEKVYLVTLDKSLSAPDEAKLAQGVQLEDGPSKLQIQKLKSHHSSYEVRMSEGRNRQIRRTFTKLGYTVRTLHRTKLGNHTLADLPEGQTKIL